MGNNTREIEPERYPEKLLYTAPANSAPEPVSNTKDHEENGRSVSEPSSGKAVNLAELKENERRFHTIFEAAPIGIGGIHDEDRQAYVGAATRYS